MVMLPSPLNLIMVMLLRKMALLHQSQLLKQVQVTIDCSETNTRLPLLCQAIELICIEMTF
jgi:hypothetical protein